MAYPIAPAIGRWEAVNFVPRRTFSEIPTPNAREGVRGKELREVIDPVEMPATRRRGVV